MVNRRLVIAGVAAAALAGAVVPSFAMTSPVTVHTDTSNGVQVSVDVNGQPGVGAHVKRDGGVCVGISYQIPFCTAGGIIGSTTPQQSIPLPPVVVRHDENGSAVGVGDVGVIVRQDGSICPVVSTQAWQCIGGN